MGRARWPSRVAACAALLLLAASQLAQVQAQQAGAGPAAEGLLGRAADGGAAGAPAPEGRSGGCCKRLKLCSQMCRLHIKTWAWHTESRGGIIGQNQECISRTVTSYCR